MDALFDSLRHEALMALAALVAWLIGEAIRRTRLGSALVKQDLIERTAMSVALGVEEHFAARMKANPALVVTAREKVDRFTAELLDKIPGIDTETAAKLAEQTVPKLGLGAAAFLKLSRERLIPGAGATTPGQ